MIVLLHAGSLRGVADIPAGAKNFHEILRMLIWSPVPIFFIISGYFFGISNYIQRGGYFDFIVKKCKTLLIPYIIFACLGTIMSIPLMLVLNHIKEFPWYDRTIFAGEYWWQWFDAIFGISTEGPLNNGPLWYVHTLFCVFLFAPFWRFMFRKLHCIFFLLPAIMCQIFVRDPFDTVIPILSARMLVVWFFVGMFLAGARSILRPERRLWAVLLFGILTLLCMLHITYLSWIEFWLPLFQFALIWTFFDLLFSPAKIPVLPDFVGFSFWIYCTHAIVSNWALPVGHYVLGEGTLSLCCLTMLNFALCLVVTIVGGFWFKLRCGAIYKVFSGGR